MTQLTLLALLLIPLARGLTQTGPAPGPTTMLAAAAQPPCSGTRPQGRAASKPPAVAEMVVELERGCLELNDVRFRPGEDTIETISPRQFAEVARALGLARGAYRVTVPPEQAAGLPPDTLQARRRGIRLKDELVHYGASPGRLRDDELDWPLISVAAPGAAIPMLVRIPER